MPWCSRYEPNACAGSVGRPFRHEIANSISITLSSILTLAASDPVLCDEELRARAPRQPFLETLWDVKKVQDSGQRYTVANQVSPTCTPEDSGSGMYYVLLSCRIVERLV